MSNLTPVIKSIQDIMRQDSGVDGDAQRISQLTWLLFLKVFDALEEELEHTRDDYQSPIAEHLRWRNWAADAEGMTGDALLDFVDKQLFPALKGLSADAQVLAGRYDNLREGAKAQVDAGKAAPKANDKADDKLDTKVAAATPKAGG